MDTVHRILDKILLLSSHNRTYFLGLHGFRKYDLISFCYLLKVNEPKTVRTA